jgi:hypothetical protein
VRAPSRNRVVDGDGQPYGDRRAASAWRQQAPCKDRMPIAWERAKETFRDALLLARVEHHEAIQGTT